MAVNYNKASYTNIMTLPKSTGRSFGAPLDPSAVWQDWSALQTYAQTDATAYVGQIVAFCGERPADLNQPTGDKVNVSEVYLIASEAGTLVKLASTTASGDLSSDVASLQSQVQGLIATIGKVSEGDVAGTGIKGDIEALQAAVADRYTKEEVNTLVSSVFRFKGTADSFTEGQLIKDSAAISGQAIGDVYLVGDAEYAWTGTAWEQLGAVLDLSDYATKAYADQAEADAITAAGEAADAKISTAVGDLGGVSVKSYLDTNYSTTTEVGTLITTAVGELGEKSVGQAYANVKDYVDTTVNALGTRVGSLETVLNGNSEDSTDGLIHRVGVLEEGSTELVSKVGTLETNYADLSAVVTGTNGLVDKVGTLESNYSALNTTVTGENGLVTRIGALEATINGSEGTPGLVNNFTTFSTLVGDLSGFGTGDGRMTLVQKVEEIDGKLKWVDLTV